MAPVPMTCLAPLVNATLTPMDILSDAIREALERAPCSDRRLALEAGISPATLSRIRSGERGASIDVAYRIAGGLQSLAGDCEAAEHAIRYAISNAEAGL